MSELYDTDILLWSEQQADLLRRHAVGANDLALDWQNIIEEVADVGRNSLRACRSQLLQSLLHDLKAEAWPLSREVPHWRSEARVARINAADAYAPSMRQRIDIAGLYAKALRALPDTIDGQPPLPVPGVCSVTLDELLSDD
jgi:predicted lipoprotein